MSVFDTQDVGATQDTPVTVKAGVEEEQTLLRALSKPVTEIAEEFATDEGTNVLGKFTAEQIKIADAVSSGAMKPSEAQVRMRANVSKYVSNFSALTEDIVQLQSKIVGTAGLGKVAVEGTEQFREEKRVRQAAMDAGYVYPGSTEEEAKEGVSMYQADQMLAKVMEQESKTLGLASSKVSLESSTMARDEQLNKIRSEKLLDIYAEQNRRRINSQVNNLHKRVNLPSNDPLHMTREEALNELTVIRASVEEGLATLGAEAGAERIKLTASPTLNYLNKTEEVILGKVSREVAENVYMADIKYTQIALVTEDPVLKEAVALENLTRNPGVSVTLTKLLAGKTLELVARGSNGREEEGIANPDLILNSSEPEKKGYFDLLKHHNSNFASGKASPEEARQLKNNNESIMKSVAKISYEDPDKYKQIVKYLASPSFGAFVKKNGGLPVGAQEANLVLERQYVDEVLPLVQQRVQEVFVKLPTGEGGDTSLMKDMVGVRYSAGAVQFFAKPEAKLSEFSKNMLRGHIEDLNKSVSPQLTLLTNMASNFNQSSPEREWETLSAEVLGSSVKKEKELTPEEEKVSAPPSPSLTEADAKYIMSADTSEEKARRAKLMGVDPDEVDKLTFKKAR